MRLRVGCAFLVSCQKMTVSSLPIGFLQQCSNCLPPSLGATCVQNSTLRPPSLVHLRTISNCCPASHNHIKATVPFCITSRPRATTDARAEGWIPGPYLDRAWHPRSQACSRPGRLAHSEQVGGRCTALLVTAPRNGGLCTSAALRASADTELGQPVKQGPAMTMIASRPWAENPSLWLQGVRALPPEQRPQPMVVVFDIETTGLGRKDHRIIEFAARDAEGGDGGAIHSLIFPGAGQSVGHSILAHHISDAMLSSALPTWGDFFPKLCAWVESRNPDARPVLFVAHNGFNFDVPLVAWECARQGWALPAEWLFADSLKIAQKYIDPKQASLPRLKELFQVPSDKAPHRAPADVDVTLHVLSRMLQASHLPLGSLYDFVLSFGVSDKKFRFGLKQEDVPAFQDLLAAGTRQRREREEAAVLGQGEGRQEQGAAVSAALEEDALPVPGIRVPEIGDGHQKEGTVSKERVDESSLLDWSPRKQTDGEAPEAGESPAVKGKSAERSPETAVASKPRMSRLRMKKDPFLASIAHWRQRSARVAKSAMVGGGEGVALPARQGDGEQGAVPRESGAGAAALLMSLSSGTELVQSGAREGLDVAAGADRALPPLARGRDRQGRAAAWPPFKAAAGDDTPVGDARAAPGRLAPAGRLMGAAGKAQTPATVRAPPPFAKAGELTARLNHLRQSVGQKQPKEVYTGGQGEGLRVRGPAVMGYAEERHEASGAGVLVRGPGVVLQARAGDAGAAQERFGPRANAGHAATEPQAPAQTAGEKEQQREGQSGERDEGARPGQRERVVTIGADEAGVSFPSVMGGQHTAEHASMQGSPSVMERYRLLAQRVTMQSGD